MTHEGEAHGADPHADHGESAYHGAPPRPYRSPRELFLLPLGIAVGAALLIAAIILSISQILLWSGDVATPIALVMAIAILLTCAYFANAPKLTRGMITLGVAAPALVLALAGAATGLDRQANPHRFERVELAKGPPAPPPEVTTDNKFSVTNFTVASGAAITVQNNGQAIHNMDILNAKDPSGNDIKTALLQPGTSAALVVALAPGTYKFQCDVHPTEMTGTIIVTPPPPAGGTGVNASTLNETTTDDKYSQTKFTVTHGVKTTLNIENKGAAVHNFDVTDATNPDGSPIKTELLQPGQSASISFEIDKPGTYNFKCDVHPTEMVGTIVVN